MNKQFMRSLFLTCPVGVFKIFQAEIRSFSCLRLVYMNLHSKRVEWVCEDFLYHNADDAGGRPAM